MVVVLARIVVVVTLLVLEIEIVVVVVGFLNVAVSFMLPFMVMVADLDVPV